MGIDEPEENDVLPPKRQSSGNTLAKKKDTYKKNALITKRDHNAHKLHSL